MWRKKVAMLMTMMVVGNFLAQTTEARSHFKICDSDDCLVVCKSHTNFPKSTWCPLTCLMACLVPTLPTPSPSPDFNKQNRQY